MVPICADTKGESIYPARVGGRGSDILSACSCFASLAFVTMGTLCGKKQCHSCEYTNYTMRYRMKSVSHLPDTNNSIGYEDKKNDNRLNKGGGRLLSFLKQCQRLGEHTGHKRTFYAATTQVTQQLTYILSGTAASLLKLVGGKGGAAGNCREKQWYLDRGAAAETQSDLQQQAPTGATPLSRFKCLLFKWVTNWMTSIIDTVLVKSFIFTLLATIANDLVYSCDDCQCQNLAIWTLSYQTFINE